MRVWGLGLRVWGLGFRVEGLGFSVSLFGVEGCDPGNGEPNGKSMEDQMEAGAMINWSMSMHGCLVRV